MRSPILPFLVCLPVLGAPAALLAQNQCMDYHKFTCDRSNDNRFSLNGQSASAAVKVGQETELNIIIYRGQDYRISLCHDDKTLGAELAIRLVEKVREPIDVVEEVSTTEPILDANGKPTGATQEVRTKRTKKVFEEVEKVLWDNTANNMAQEVEFSCAATKRIAVEVNAPGGAETTNKKKEQYDIGCVGILVEHMPTPGLGFEPPAK